MTLEEAIIHCKEKACDNTQCSIEHEQLAEWLQELQQYRKNEYIRKDLLVEWAEAHKVNCIGDYYTNGRNDAMDLLIKMLDLL